MTEIGLSVALALFAVCAVACTSIPPPPGSGTGGGMGDADGMVGSGGIGGGAGGAFNPCALIDPEEPNEIEVGDGVQAGLAIGRVCGGDCTTPDPLDQWPVTNCGGTHTIRLTWDNPNADLNLFLLDADESLIDQATGVPLQASPTEVYREVSGDLTGDEPYLIEVRPGDTGGIPQAYNVRVSRDD